MFPKTPSCGIVVLLKVKALGGFGPQWASQVVRGVVSTLERWRHTGVSRRRVLIAGFVVGSLLVLSQDGARLPYFLVDPAVARAQLQIIPPVEEGTDACPSCVVLESLEDRFAAAAQTAQERFTRAANRLAGSQVSHRRSESRQHARSALSGVMVRAQEDRFAASRLKQRFAQARRQCGQGTFCATPGGRSKIHHPLSCPAEIRPLNDEAIEIRNIIERIERLATSCLAQSCPTLSCVPAEDLDTHMGQVEAALAALLTMPFGGVDDGAEFPVSPLGVESRRLVEATLRIPQALPALFHSHELARGALPGSEIIGFAEEISRLGQWADELSGRLEPVVDGLSGGGAGLWRIKLISTRLWRLYEDLRQIAIARGEATLRRGAALQVAWERFAHELAALTLDGLRLEAELKRRPTDEAALRISVCRARQEEPHRALTRDLALARARLARCVTRAGCPAAGAARGGAVALGANTTWTETLSALDQDVRLATGAASRLSLRKPQRALLETDYSNYAPGEAVRLSVDLRSLTCMAEPGASAALLGPQPGPPGPETADQAQTRLGRILDLADLAPGESTIEAPTQPGTYVVKTFAPPGRGGLETGAARFDVDAPPETCKGFAGSWDTDFGILRLAVRNGVARGSYRRPRAGEAGFLFGTVTDGVLIGQWHSELGTGGTRLTLEPDEQSFKGTWSQTPGVHAGTGTWSGLCLSKPRASDQAAAGSGP